MAVAENRYERRSAVQVPEHSPEAAIQVPEPSVSRHAAGAGGALAAARDRDGHGALVADLAGNREGGAARIADRAVLDLDRIAVGAVAGALFGDDQDAPVAVEARLGGATSGRETPGRARSAGSRAPRRRWRGGSSGRSSQAPDGFEFRCQRGLTHACFGRMLGLFRLCRAVAGLFRRHRQPGLSGAGQTQKPGAGRRVQ